MEEFIGSTADFIEQYRSTLAESPDKDNYLTKLSLAVTLFAADRYTEAAEFALQVAQSRIDDDPGHKPQNRQSAFREVKDAILRLKNSAQSSVNTTVEVENMHVLLDQYDFLMRSLG